MQIIFLLHNITLKHNINFPGRSFAELLQRLFPKYLSPLIPYETISMHLQGAVSDLLQENNLEAAKDLMSKTIDVIYSEPMASEIKQKLLDQIEIKHALNCIALEEAIDSEQKAIIDFYIEQLEKVKSPASKNDDVSMDCDYLSEGEKDEEEDYDGEPCEIQGLYDK